MIEPIARVMIMSALAAALAACAVGPDYERPLTQEGPQYARQDVLAQETAMPAPDALFWRELGDPELTGLIESALAASPDIRVALARYDEANALLGASRLDRYPTLGGSAEATTGRSSASQLPGVPRSARDGELFDARLTAIWELDFFGRVRRGVERSGPRPKPRPPTWRRSRWPSSRSWPRRISSCVARRRSWPWPGAMPTISATRCA